MARSEDLAMNGLKRQIDLINEIGAYIPEDSVYHPSIYGGTTAGDTIVLEAWRTPGDLAGISMNPNNPARLAEWKIRSESPDITCVMTENGPRFEVEEGSEGLERYAEAKSIADRLNANIGRVSELLRETSPKTEFIQS